MACDANNTADVNSLLCLDINDPINNAGNISNCVENIEKFIIGSLPITGTRNNQDCNKLLLGANYITSITTLIGQQKEELVKNKNNIATFKESINQQVNPETTINVHSQRTGIFAPPRPLKPLSVSILLGTSFTFFLISLAIVYKMLMNNIPSRSIISSALSFSAIKDMCIGLLLIVILIMGLKVGNVI